MAFSVSLPALGFGIVNFRQAQADRVRAVEERLTTQRLAADALLNQAWDLMGGEAAAGTITVFEEEAERLGRARRLIDQALVQYPDYARVYVTNATFLMSQSLWPAALEALDSALALDSTSATALLNRAVALEVLAQEGAAVPVAVETVVDAYEQAIAADSLNPVGFRNLARYRLAMSDTAEAKANLESARLLQPESSQLALLEERLTETAAALRSDAAGAAGVRRSRAVTPAPAAAGTTEFGPAVSPEAERESDEIPSEVVGVAPEASPEIEEPAELPPDLVPFGFRRARPVETEEPAGEALRRLSDEHPEYTAAVSGAILQCFTWNGRDGLEATIAFRIERSGSLSRLRFVRGSGSGAFDTAAIDALGCAGSGRIRPLPSGFDVDGVPAQFTFTPRQGR